MLEDSFNLNFLFFRWGFLLYNPRALSVVHWPLCIAVNIADWWLQPLCCQVKTNRNILQGLRSLADSTAVTSALQLAYDDCGIPFRASHPSPEAHPCFISLTIIVTHRALFITLPVLVIQHWHPLTPTLPKWLINLQNKQKMDQYTLKGEE